MKNTLLINLFAGPGSGKTTLMAEVFCKLKWANISCEQAPEYIKTKVWEQTSSENGKINSFEIGKDQLYIFGKQVHTIRMLMGKVDVIVTDSPILLSVIYNSRENKLFNDFVLEEFKQYTSINYFIRRIKKYDPNGRCQTEDEAIQKDLEILQMLNKFNIPFTNVDGISASAQKIYGDILYHNALNSSENL